MTLGKATSFDAAQDYGFVCATDNPREMCRAYVPVRNGTAEEVA